MSITRTIFQSICVTMLVLRVEHSKIIPGWILSEIDFGLIYNHSNLYWRLLIRKINEHANKGLNHWIHRSTITWAKNPTLITNTLIRTWCVVPDVITSVRSKTTRLPRKSLANISLFVNISLTGPVWFNGFMAFICFVYHHQMLHIRMGLIVRHITRNSILILWFFDQKTIGPQFNISKIRSIRTKHTSTCPIFGKNVFNK